MGTRLTGTQLEFDNAAKAMDLTSAIAIYKGIEGIEADFRRISIVYVAVCNDFDVFIDFVFNNLDIVKNKDDGLNLITFITTKEQASLFIDYIGDHVAKNEKHYLDVASMALVCNNFVLFKEVINQGYKERDTYSVSSGVDITLLEFASIHSAHLCCAYLTERGYKFNETNNMPNGLLFCHMSDKDLLDRSTVENVFSSTYVERYPEYNLLSGFNWVELYCESDASRAMCLTYLLFSMLSANNVVDVDSVGILKGKLNELPKIASFLDGLMNNCEFTEGDYILLKVFLCGLELKDKEQVTCFTTELDRAGMKLTFHMMKRYLSEQNCNKVLIRLQESNFYF
jgi:hypothetical protein